MAAKTEGTDRGEYIRGLRKARGWSQEELARRARLSISSVKRYERGGNLHMESLDPLAGALGVSVGELLGRPAASAASPSEHYRAFLAWLDGSTYRDVHPSILQALAAMNPPEAELLEEDYRAIFRILYERQHGRRG